MRTFWMASAALVMAGGIACAQTSTPAPAPNGAVNAPTTNAPDAPGKTAPDSGTATMAPSASQPTDNGNNGNGMSSSPAPTGAITAPSEAPPGAAPGKTAPNAGSQSMVSPTHQTHHMHHWPHTGALPKNASPVAYLHMAKAAIASHDYNRAGDALSHAETRLLTRSVSQASSISTDHSPAVRAIERARHALRDHDSAGAMSATEDAMHAVHMHHRNASTMAAPNNALSAPASGSAQPNGIAAPPSSGPSAPSTNSQ
jgi:hypothetical protein